MKIKSLRINTKKKAFEVSIGQESFHYPFSQMNELKKEVIKGAYIDQALGGQGFTCVFESGREQTIHMDQILEYGHQQDYLKEMLLYKLTVKALKILKDMKINKREVIRRLKTSPTQFYRLIDPTFYHKTIDQMVRLLGALDCEVDLVVKKAA